MATAKRRQLTYEERAERRRREQELTERAVAQLRSSEGWQRWLAVRARVGLRRYRGCRVSSGSVGVCPGGFKSIWR